MPRTRRAVSHSAGEEDQPVPPAKKAGSSSTKHDESADQAASPPMTMAELKQQHANLKLQLQIKRMEREATQQALAAAASRPAMDVPAAKRRKVSKTSPTPESDPEEVVSTPPPPKRSKSSKRPSSPAESDEEGDDDCAALMSHALREMYDFELPDPVDKKGDVLKPFLIAGATVNKKIKTKIWNFEYIELGMFAPSEVAKSNKPDLNVDYDRGNVSQISLTASKAKKASNFYDWLRWFSKYAAIYCQKHSAEAPAIFTYITRIMSLHKENSVWREYDEEFRKVRAISQLPWHFIDSHVLSEAKELVPKSQSNFSNHRSNSQSRQDNSRSNKAKICYDYQKSTGCKRSPCPYPHVCRVCAAPNHGANRCFKSKQKSTKSPSSASQGKRQ